MDVYLSRHFLNPATGRQQRHLFMRYSDFVLYEWIGEDPYANLPVFDGTGDWAKRMEDHLKAKRFFEQTFQDAAPAIAAYQALASKAIADGYFLTSNMDRMIDAIPPDAKPKPDWQQTIDHRYLQMAGGDTTGSIADDTVAQLAKFEPLWMAIVARRLHGNDPSRAAAVLPFAVAARDELNRRKAAKEPFYCWSISPIEIESDILEHLYDLYTHLKDDPNAFAAIREANDLSPDLYRTKHLALMQCYVFPQYREDAFETAFAYDSANDYIKSLPAGTISGMPEPDNRYGQIKQHPHYAAYATRRKAEVENGKPVLRWHAMTDPADPKDITAADTALPRPLPLDYRVFLAKRGRSKLDLYLGRNTSTLKFAGPVDLIIWAEVFHHWLDQTGDTGGNHSDDWKAKFGVERNLLISVATPWDNSSCLAMSLAEGRSQGHCYLWHHDEAYDLVPIGDNFDTAIKTVETGFISGDRRIRAFFA